MLEFNIRNQEISRIDNFSPAEKSVEYLIAKFNFKTEDWNEAIKRAIFRNVKSKVEKDTMIEDDSCVVPWEVLVGSGDIEVSVHGVIGTKEITSDVAVFNLNRTLQGGSATQEPSLTVYEQMVEMVKDAKEVAQSVRDDADNGKFSGIPGEKGEDGKSAYQYAVEGGFKGTEAEFTDLMGKPGGVDLTGYVSKEQHEAELLKTMVKVTTDKAPYHHITDSANMKVLDFGMEGITEQDTVAGNQLFDISKFKSSGQAINNGDGTISLINYPPASKVHKISECFPTIYVGQTIRMSATNLKLVSFGGVTCGAGVNTKITVTQEMLDNNSFGFYGKDASTSSDNPWVLSDIMFNEGTTILPYEPFVGNMPSPNPDYEQPTTLAGVLNEETGRYEHKCVISDESEENSQPFTLTSDRPLTKWDNLVKVDGKWYWDYKQQHWSINDTADWYAYDSYKGFFAQCCFPVLLTNNEGYCNQLRNDTVGISPSKVSNHFWIGNNRDHFYVLGSSYYDESLEDKGLANWKAHLNEHPLEIVTYKDESELVPLLDEEQTLLHHLETYYGVTNVYNEQGCPMWLTYVTDTKLYVDQKLLEIQQAII